MKKRIIACLLSVMAMASVPMAVYADNVTHLTTTVPDATYTLNIPADQEIAFGATGIEIGEVTVTNASGFAKGKNLEVTVTYDDFVSEAVSTTIPYILRVVTTDDPNMYGIASGNEITFKGNSDGTVFEEGYISQSSGAIGALRVHVSSEDWGKALGGDYSSEIVFTAKVVVE